MVLCQLDFGDRNTNSSLWMRAVHFWRMRRTLLDVPNRLLLISPWPEVWHTPFTKPILDKKNLDDYSIHYFWFTYWGGRMRTPARAQRLPNTPKNVGSISMDKVGADSWITNQQSVPWEGSKVCLCQGERQRQSKIERDDFYFLLNFFLEIDGKVNCWE